MVEKVRRPRSDAEALTQEVLLAVSKDLARFEHRGQPGAFRGWLKAILVNRLRKFWRARKRRPQARGDSDIGSLDAKMPLPITVVNLTNLTQASGKTMRINSVIRGSALQVFCTLCVIAPPAWSDEVPRRVLLIQDAEHPEGSEFLADSLRKHQLSVDVQPSGQLFDSLNELKRYASVILVGVPRDGGIGCHFTDEQIRL